jgi:DNA-binding HxlR family transcriptional regulator
LESKGSRKGNPAQEGTPEKPSIFQETNIVNQQDSMKEKSGKIIDIGDGRTIDTANCPVRQVLDRIGDKWSTLVILMLGERGVTRFNGISQAIGDISQKMLTTTLRNLEADGLISRTMYPEIPPRVEYALTELGQSLLPLIRQLQVWADEKFEVIEKNRKKYANQNSNRKKETA